MKFYPHGGTANFTSFLQSASLAITASHLENPNRPVLSASLALTADPMFMGPTGNPGTDQTVTGPSGPSGSAGASGPRGLGGYTGSLTTATCCDPFSTVCLGTDLYSYGPNCELQLACVDIISCGGSNSFCA